LIKAAESVPREQRGKGLRASLAHDGRTMIVDRASALSNSLPKANFGVLSMATNRWSIPSPVLTSAMSTWKKSIRYSLEHLLGLLLTIDLG
jgi:hypothetical protein